ncbi:Uncharacterised protein r2_g4316 [Pycnogonum litorale]
MAFVLSPFELLQVRQPRLGIDVRRTSTAYITEEEFIRRGQVYMESMRGHARRRLEEASKKQSTSYDARNTVDASFSVGEMVYWKRPPPGSKKLLPVWQGTFSICDQLGPKTFIIEENDGVKSTVNIDQLNKSRVKDRMGQLRGSGRPRKKNKVECGVKTLFCKFEYTDEPRSDGHRCNGHRIQRTQSARVNIWSERLKLPGEANRDRYLSCNSQRSPGTAGFGAG